MGHVTTIPQNALETYFAQVLEYLEIGTVIIFPISQEYKNIGDKKFAKVRAGKGEAGFEPQSLITQVSF